MAKYWFGSLEQITEQYDDKGHLMPTAMKAVKGWKVLAGEYASDAEKITARNALAETWWQDAETWWLAQPNQLDTKGGEMNPDTRHLDHVPIRETNDFQLRITGPVEVPEPEAPKAKDEKKGGVK